MSEKIELPAELYARAMAELSVARGEDAFPTELVEGEIQQILLGAAGILGLVVRASRAIATSVEMAHPVAHEVLRDVASEVGADNAEIGEEELLQYLHEYFSAGVAGEIIAHLAGAARPSG